MRRLTWIRHAPLAVALLAGCSPTTPAPITPTAPHGGSLTPLPNDRGVVEVVREEAGKPGQIRLSAYYLDKDLKPSASPPDSATFTPRGRGVRPVALKLGPDGALTSEPFGGTEGLSGTLVSAFDGKPDSGVVLNVR